MLQYPLALPTGVRACFDLHDYSRNNGPREIVTRSIQPEDFSAKLLFVSFIWLPILTAWILLLLAGIAATAALLFLARTLGLIALLLLALFLLVALLGRLVLAHLIVVTIHENLPCAP